MDEDACSSVISKLNVSGPQLAGELSRIICINRGQECFNAFSKISIAQRKQLVEVMDKVCDQTAGKICRELADIYIELGDYKKAISSAKKQFAKSKDGIYPLYEYKYGDRAKGIKAARINCANDENSCCF